MERLPPRAWGFDGMDDVADWADELQHIPSSTLSGHRKAIVACGARIDKLAEAAPPVQPVPTPRKSLRTKGKASVEQAEVPIPGDSGSLQPGDVFVNAVKVRAVL